MEGIFAVSIFNLFSCIIVDTDYPVRQIISRFSLSRHQKEKDVFFRPKLPKQITALSIIRLFFPEPNIFSCLWFSDFQFCLYIILNISCISTSMSASNVAQAVRRFLRSSFTLPVVLYLNSCSRLAQ